MFDYLMKIGSRETIFTRTQQFFFIHLFDKAVLGFVFFFANAINRSLQHTFTGVRPNISSYMYMKTKRKETKEKRMKKHLMAMILHVCNRRRTLSKRKRKGDDGENNSWLRSSQSIDTINMSMLMKCKREREKKSRSTNHDARFQRHTSHLFLSSLFSSFHHSISVNDDIINTDAMLI